MKPQPLQPEHKSLPWPNYWQWTIDFPAVSTTGCFLGIAAAVILALLRLGAYLPLALAGLFTLLVLGPVLVVGAVNAIKWIGWRARVAKSVTWDQAAALVETAPDAYEVLGVTLFTGPTSFGTYRQIGGWDAYLLRDRRDATLRVLRGTPPNPATLEVPWFVD